MKKTTQKTTGLLFREPQQMQQRLGQPRSIRFDVKTEEFLIEEAQQVGMGFSTLISQICDDYVKWLQGERAKR